MADQSKLSKLAGATGQVVGGVQAVGNLFGIGQKKQDKRQVKQQRELNKVNEETARNLASYENNLKLKMWKDTNYAAQMEQAGLAGLSKTAVLGGSGSGVAQGASVSGVGGGAADAASTQNANTQSAMMMAQLANLEANTKKTNAEAENIGGVDRDIKGLTADQMRIETEVKQRIGVDRYVRRGLIEQDSLNSKDAKQVREFQSWMETMYDQDSMTINVDNYGSYGTSENDFIRKVMKAGGEELIEKVNNLKKDIDLKDSQTGLNISQAALNAVEEEIKNFRVDLSKLGLNEQTTALLGIILGAAFGMVSKGMGKPKDSKRTTGTTTYNKKGNVVKSTVSSTTNRVNIPRAKR